MKACIYQKQEPVDIPQSETRVLKDVLALPWGFEIYSLMTRWNPLNLRRPLPLAPTGKRVLVVGTGPAGFTLAHHLINDGHTVVAIDGLKIEPLAADVSGVTSRGARVPFSPVRDIETLREPLDDRIMAGFGGVAEYGITVRWDKNFLKLVRLLLERRDRFALYGGVRFGGTLDAKGAFAMGFDHIALAAGAGKPTVLDLPNGLANGVRTASDFLMALQLTGAAKRDSLANMQLRLPVVVIGGGLTAIDTATESLAYYPVQVEKFLARYETLAAEADEASVRAGWQDDERDAADTYLEHARAIRAERERARAEARAPRVRELLDSWGGVTIAYRRRLIDSPSYTLNHEEVEKALEEGIRFAEGLTPLAVEVDARGRAAALAVSVAAARRRGRVARDLAREPAGTNHSHRRGDAAQHGRRARGPVALSPRRPLFPGARRGRAARRTRARHRQTGDAVRPHRARSGRPRHQLFRRPASFVLRQRGQGDGQRHAGLSDREPDAGSYARRIPTRRRAVHRRPRRRFARDGRAGRATRADHRRSRRARAGRGAAFRSPDSSIGCRISRRWPAMPAARVSPWKAWR